MDQAQEEQSTKSNSMSPRMRYSPSRNSRTVSSKSKYAHSRKGQNTCKFYFSEEGCKKGDNCTFIHPDPIKKRSDNVGRDCCDEVYQPLESEKEIHRTKTKPKSMSRQQRNDQVSRGKLSYIPHEVEEISLIVNQNTEILDVKDKEHESASSESTSIYETNNTLSKIKESRNPTRNNDKSTSVEAKPKAHLKPTPEYVCKYFRSKQGCLHGRNCRFKHVFPDLGPVKELGDSNTKSNTKRPKHVAIPKKPHNLNIRPDRSKVDRPTVSNLNVPLIKTVPDEGYVNNTIPQQVRCQSVNEKLTSNEHTSDDAVTRSNTLREVELKQLEARFARQKKCMLINEGPPTIYTVDLSPTDPDWPFIIQEITIEVSFPESYPAEMFMVKVEESEQFPEGFSRYINVYISDWIGERSLNRMSSDLAFRPFLKWFDKNLEQLFTNAAQQVKKDMDASAAGLQFIPHENLQERLNQSNDENINASKHTNTEDEKHEVCQHSEIIFANDSNNASCETTDVNREQYVKDQPTEHLEIDFGKVTLVTGQNNCQETISETVDDNSGDNDQLIIIKLPDDYQEEQTVGIEDILEVCRRPLKDAHAESKWDTLNTDEGEGTAAVSSSVKNKGTEIKFRYLDLSESAASLTVSYIAVTVQCRRCHTRSDMKGYANRTIVIVCDKCRNRQSLTYKPEIVHHFSTLLGFLFLEGCKAFDLLLLDCVLIVNCLNCSKDSQIKGIGYGQKRDHWCPHCHQKIDIKIEGVRFQDPKLDIDSAKFTTIPAKKKATKEPGIREGRPLLDNGTCKHFKKSYRWLRFPCCGKCYPCDVCHEENEDHEMKFATRMVCGFCSKEQPFSMEKPCISCNANMKRARSSHWEGGRGCRNKTKMNRNDKRKFAGSEKQYQGKQKPQHKGNPINDVEVMLSAAI